MRGVLVALLLATVQALTGGAHAAPTPAPPPPAVPRQGGLVLKCSATGSTAVYHGPMWTQGVAPGAMYYEALVSPTASCNGYVILDNTSGAHRILFGCIQVGSTSFCRPAGNLNSDSTPGNSIDAFDSLAYGEWGVLAVYNDGLANGLTWTYIDHVPVGVAHVTGTPTVPTFAPGSGITELFVCNNGHAVGPDFEGKVAWIRGFDGDAAVPSTISSHPYWTFQGELWPGISSTDLSEASTTFATFFADYTVPGRVIADHSDGYGGHRHPGKLVGQVLGGAVARGMGAGYTAPSYPWPQWVLDSTAPISTTTAPSHQSLGVDTPATTPSGAVIFDSFSRKRSTLLFGTPSLGNTEAVIGQTIKTWATFSVPGSAVSTTNWGIMNNRAAWLDTLAGGAVVDLGSQSQEVRVTRNTSSLADEKTTGTCPSGGRCSNVGIVWRYVDRNNFCFTYSYASKTDTFWPGTRSDCYVSGSLQAAMSADGDPGNTTWDELRVDVSGSAAGGTTVELRVCTAGTCASPFKTYTSITTPAGTKVGIYAQSETGAAGAWATRRWDNFTACTAGGC